MRHLTMSSTNDIYSCAKALHVLRYRIAHSELRSLCFLINSFNQQLGDFAKEDYWLAFLRWLQRYRFHMTSAPLPFDWVDPRFPEMEADLETHLGRCEQIYPQFALSAFQLQSKFLEVRKISDNPLLEELVKSCDFLEEGIIAVMVKSSRLVVPTSQIINSHPLIRRKNIQVVCPTSFDYTQCYQHLFVIGATHWFPEHIFSAPRSRNIYPLAYNWLNMRWPVGESFVNGDKNIGEQDKVGDVQIFTGFYNVEHPQPDIDDVENALSTMNAAILSKRLSETMQASDFEQEAVSARLLVLAQDWGVFIEAADQTKVLVLNLQDYDEELKGRIQRISVNTIKPGMFILLRTEGGGDYIIPVANSIMGPAVTRLVRESQLYWKGLLRRKVLSRGLFQTCIDLLDLGSVTANEVNVRNWINPRKIRPNSKEDFRAILRLVGLEADFDTYWSRTDIILNAHRKAGFRIREQLLHEIQATNLTSLAANGWVDFVLPEADGGKLSAIRIEYVDQAIFQVPSSRIGDLLTLE